MDMLCVCYGCPVDMLCICYMGCGNAKWTRSYAADVCPMRGGYAIDVLWPCYGRGMYMPSAGHVHANGMPWVRHGYAADMRWICYGDMAMCSACAIAVPSICCLHAKCVRQICKRSGAETVAYAADMLRMCYGCATGMMP